MRVDHIQLLQIAEVLSDLEKIGNQETRCVKVVTWQRAISYNPILGLTEQLGSWNMV
jgi:hypothetical protein